MLQPGDQYCEATNKSFSTSIVIKIKHTQVLIGMKWHNGTLEEKISYFYAKKQTCHVVFFTFNYPYNLLTYFTKY